MAGPRTSVFTAAKTHCTISDNDGPACDNGVVGRSFLCYLLGHKYSAWGASHLIDADLISRMCHRCCSVHVVWLEGESLVHWHSRDEA